MAEKEYEEDDPFVFVGARAEPEEGRDHLREMGLAFIDEFRRMGWPDDRILAMFRNPFYRGPHGVLAARGEAYVRRLLEGG